MKLDSTSIHTKEFWDKRSEKWVKNFDSEDVRLENEARYETISTFLFDKGLIDKNSEVLDIGCGPGLFTARFAKGCKTVTGLDISEKMIEHALENTVLRGLKNVCFLNIPWQDIDLEALEMRGKYDLVFASLCPGISNEKELLKMSFASRGWCCTCGFARKFSSLKDQIHQYIMGIPCDQEWGKKSLPKNFEVLSSAGYFPYVTYFDFVSFREWRADEETARHFASRLGGFQEEEENIQKYGAKVLAFLKSLAKNGVVADENRTKIACLYWKVTD